MDGEENTYLNLYFNIIIPSSLGLHILFPSSFSTEILLNLLYFSSHSFHVLIPSYLLLFNNSIQLFLPAGSTAQWSIAKIIIIIEIIIGAVQIMLQLCSFLHLHLSSLLLRPNISLSSLFL